MSVRHRLITDDNGRPVLRKEATGADAARLRHEAEMLRAAAHPGVVDVLSIRDLDGGGLELTLAVPGVRTVADLDTDLEGAAGFVAALATTVADLHALGVAHGRVRAEHVLVDGGGRPVLCGFAGAGALGSAPDLAPAADVAGIGTVLRLLVTGGRPAPPDWEPIPTRRLGRRDAWTGFTRRALLTLADQATADDPGHRPTARALASSILATIPAARLPGAAAPPDDRPSPTRRPGDVWSRAAAPVAGTVGLGLLVFGLGGLLRPSPAPRATSAAAADPAPVTTAPPVAATRPTTVAPVQASPIPTTTTTSPTSTGPPPPAGPAIEVLDGVVVVDGRRYAIGEAGDRLAVGDWDCDGDATVAVVRPATGAVFVFEAWATPGGDLTVPAVTTVAGGVTVAADDPDGDGCPDLVVTAAGGERTVVA